jgi:uncharacterized protein YyaL (SSP411 family)
LLELFQADGDAQWLEWAQALQARQNALFWDPVEGGWFSTTGKDQSVLLRLKEDYDGAEPAASSIGVLNLLAFAHLSPEPTAQNLDPRVQIDLTLGSFASRAAQSGRIVPMMLAALSTYHAGMPQVVIVSDGDSRDAQALRDVVRRQYLPTSITVPVNSSTRDHLNRVLPWIASMKPREGLATAYVCRDFSCQAPTTDRQDLDRQLRVLS